MAKRENTIKVVNAQQHNLKNITVEIPQQSFTVVTGVSGSGKSSLVFDTLFAEGQRRYVESLSSYARQFMGRMKKPAVDDIQGLCPAVAIEQKVNTRNPRSTVATSTEIYDYIKLLFSRVGHTISPISQREVKRETTEDVFNWCQSQPGLRILILAPIGSNILTIQDINILIQKGFSRIWANKEIFSLQDLIDDNSSIEGSLYLLIDRLKIDLSDDEFQSRLFDATESAFWEGDGTCIVVNSEDNTAIEFNNRFELDGMKFEIPTKDFLSLIILTVLASVAKDLGV